MRPDEFAAALSVTADADLPDFCRKYLLHGTPVLFAGREEDYYEFRKRIASNFEINYDDIFITGSARLGFSPFKSTEFSLDSDVDVAIVSDVLYDRVMDRIRAYQMQLRASHRAVSRAEIDRYHDFLEYTAMGWIRPDKLPPSFQVGDLKTEWFEFFASISYGKSETGNYKVSAGVFRTSRHLELYVVEGLTAVKRTMEVDQAQ